MKSTIKGIKIFKAKIYKDNRGHFKEAYNKKKLKNEQLIFHCTSSSKKNVLRGLHLQTKNPQAKFLTVITKDPLKFVEISDPNVLDNV
jgi:dTDP-4-dehydrorhamnose 3,5-epimerase